MKTGEEKNDDLTQRLQTGELLRLCLAIFFFFPFNFGFECFQVVICPPCFPPSTVTTSELIHAFVLPALHLKAFQFVIQFSQ